MGEQMSDDIRTFTPADDIYEALKSGRGRVIVAHAGVAMPWSRLVELGLTDDNGKPTIKGKTEQPEAEARPKAKADAPQEP
jgi:hypothetical protein